MSSGELAGLQVLRWQQAVSLRGGGQRDGEAARGVGGPKR